MNKNEIPCDDGSLVAMLHRQVSGAEQETLLEHVENCERCQGRLEQLAATEEEWQLAGESLAASSRAAGEDADERGRAFQASRWTERPVAWTETMAKLLLAPPTHPEMLGRLGRYEVERLIGTGGMGIVFKAYDTELNRVVAIKVLAPYLSGSGAARQRFAREARAAAAVVHDHVVPIHNVETEQASPFLVMQYVAGESLQARLDREGALERCEILRIGMQVAAGLSAAHVQGLVHRDIKPSNILLEPSIERALITDFGLARAADDASITNTGFHPGTPLYMSPEQAAGETVDARSDLFSLGSVLYAMCTGRPPFRAESSLAVLRRIIDDQPRRIREINPAIPEWLERIVMKLLSKAPDERWASASDVALLLEKCLAHLQQPTVHELPEAVREPVASNSTRSSLPRAGRGRRVLSLVLGSTLAAMVVGGSIAVNRWAAWFGPPVGEAAAAAAVVGPFVDCEVPLHDTAGKVRLVRLRGVCVSEEGLVVLPLSAASLADRNSIKAIQPAGDMTVVGSDESHRLTLLQFKPRGQETLKYLKSRVALPRKGERFSIATERQKEVAVTSVGQEYELPLRGNDGFLVEPMHGAPIGTAIVTRDDELVGLMLQVSAFDAQVENDELRNVNLPAVHIQNLVEEFRAAKSGTPQIVSAEAPRSVVSVLPAGGLVSRLAGSPDGEQIAMVSYRGTGMELRLVAVDSRKAVFHVPSSKLDIIRNDSNAGNDDAATEIQDGVTSLEFCPYGKLLALGTFLGEVRVFDANTGEVLHTLDNFRSGVDRELFEKMPLSLKNRKRALGMVRALAFSPDGKRLAVAGESFLDTTNSMGSQWEGASRSVAPGRLKVWDFDEENVTYCNGHSEVWDVAFSSDGRFMAAAGRWDDGDDRGGGVILWEAGSSEPFHKLPHDANDFCVGVRFLPNQRRLVSIAYRDYQGKKTHSLVVRLTDLDSGKIEWERIVPAGFRIGGFSDDNSVGIQCADWTFRLLDLATGEERLAFRPASAPSRELPVESNWLLLPRRNSLALAPACNDPDEGRVEIWSLNEGSNSVVQREPKTRVPSDRGVQSFAAAPQLPEGPQELLQRLVRGGKIDSRSLDTMITTVARHASQDETFARSLLEEFRKSCAGGDRAGRLRRDLLDVLVEFFRAGDDLSWQPSPHAKQGDDVQVANAATSKMADIKAEFLALVVREAHAASNTEIATFTLVARQTHHRDARAFLLEVLRNPALGGPDDVYSDPLDVPAPPSRGEVARGTTSPTTPPKEASSNRPIAKQNESHWKEPSGAMWPEAQFIAAVGLAESGEAEGVEWLLAKARPNDFGLDHSLWQYPHVRDQMGSLKESSRLALCELFRMDGASEIAALNDWWIRRSSSFQGGRVRLKLGARITPLHAPVVEQNLQDAANQEKNEGPELMPRRGGATDHANQIAWGESEGDLQAGVGYRPPRITGEPAQLFVWLRNNGQETVRVRPRPLWLSTAHIRTLDSQQKLRGLAPVDVESDTARSFVAIQAGQTVEIGVAVIRLDDAVEQRWASEHPAKDLWTNFASPGRYEAQFVDLLDDMPKLATGTVSFVYREEARVANDSDKGAEKLGLQWYVGFSPIRLRSSSLGDAGPASARYISARYIDDWTGQPVNKEAVRRFDDAMRSLDMASPEQLEASVDRLIAESADWPVANRAALMFNVMMVAHEWLGREQVQHAGFEGTLFERVKHKCAMTGLAEVDAIPTGLALRFLEFATWSQLSWNTNADPNWPAQRRLKTKLWLTQVERVRRAIDPNWDETDLPRIQNDVDAGRDAATQAEYEPMLEAEKKKSERYNEQLYARRLLAEVAPRMEEDLVRMHVRKPLDLGSLELLLKEYSSDAATQTRVAKTVRLFHSIVPQGTRLKYGWPDGLAEAGEAGVPRLLEAVQDKDYLPFVRLDGIWALGVIGDPRALPVFRELADDDTAPEKYRSIAREFARVIEKKANKSSPKPDGAATEEPTEKQEPDLKRRDQAVPGTSIDPAEELAAFQGMWCFDLLQLRVWPEPIGVGTDSFGRQSEKRWLVKGNRISWVSQEGRRIEVDFTIDSTKSPKQIDFTFRTGPHRGAKCLGIYERQKGDSNYLWLCMTNPGVDAPRPTEIAYSSFKPHSMIGLFPVMSHSRPTAAKAIERLRGTWQMELCDSTNREFGGDPQDVAKWQWTIEGEEISWRRQDQVWKAKFSVDPSKSPNEIDLTYLDGPFKGQTCQGIYVFGGVDGQTLMISIQDPGSPAARPVDISMRGGVKTSLIFLRPSQPNEREREMGALQGNWTLKRFDTAQVKRISTAWPLPGGTRPDKSGNGSQLRWTLKGNEITWTDAEGKEIRASFVSDSKKSPKQIDLTFLNGPHQGETCLGIYQRGDLDPGIYQRGDLLDENILWICINDPGSKADRPTTFSYQSSAGRSLLSLYPADDP